MPQLQSGRHVGFVTHFLRSRIQEGTNEQIWATAAAFRMRICEPKELIPWLEVVAYNDGESPSDSSAYLSGFTVAKVLAGDADWTDAEVAELKELVTADPRFLAWLGREFQEIHQLILSNPVWSSEFVLDD